MSMERLVMAAAILILVLWAASIVLTMFLPERSVNPSLQIAMVATTTFLFGTAALVRRK